MAQSDAEQHEDEDDMCLSGFALLRARFNQSQQTSRSASARQSAPKASAAPAPKTAPKARPSGSVAKAPSASSKRETGPATEARKTVVGNAGKGLKRKVQDSGLSLDPFADVDATGLSEIGMSEGDLSVLSHFKDKLNPLIVISPPVADDAFKQYIGEKINQLTHIANDLKVKKKSAGRRKGDNIQDQTFTEELTAMESRVRQFVRTLKCSTVVYLGIRFLFMSYDNYVFFVHHTENVILRICHSWPPCEV